MNNFFNDIICDIGIVYIVALVVNSSWQSWTCWQPHALKIRLGHRPLFLHQGLIGEHPSASVSVSSATVSLFSPKQEVADWDTWAPAAVLSSDLRGLLALGMGLRKEGSAATDFRNILALPLVAN